MQSLNVKSLADSNKKIIIVNAAMNGGGQL